MIFNPRFKLQDLLFHATLTPPPNKKSKRTTIGLDIMAIIGQCICCITRELNRASCDAAYASFGMKG